jgi:hypothetical protein
MEGMIQMAGSPTTPDEVYRAGGQVIDGTVYLPLKYINELAQDPAYTILIAEITRPGVQFFTTKLEYTLFPPGTQSNEQFNFGVYQWDDCVGLPFLVAFFPSEYRESAEEIAACCDIWFANKELVTLSPEGKMVKFPIVGPSVYKLDNLPGSRVFAGALNLDGGKQGYQERMRALMQEEREKTKRFLESVGALTQEKPDA